MVYVIICSIRRKPVLSMIVDDLSWEDLCWELAEVQAAGYQTEMVQAIPPGTWLTSTH